MYYTERFSIRLIGFDLVGLILGLFISLGVLDNNPEQIRNKLKISAYVLETAYKTISKVR